MGYIQKKAMDIGTEISIFSEGENIQAKVIKTPFFKKDNNEK